MANRIVLNETSYFGRGSRVELANEIKARGYFISRTHFKLTGMRTDMPLKELKELIIKNMKDGMWDILHIFIMITDGRKCMEIE